MSNFSKILRVLSSKSNLNSEPKNKNIPSVFCESTVSNESQMIVVSETGANYGGDLFVDSLSLSFFLLS